MATIDQAGNYQTRYPSIFGPLADESQLQNELKNDQSSGVSQNAVAQLATQPRAEENDGDEDDETPGAEAEEPADLMEPVERAKLPDLKDVAKVLHAPVSEETKKQALATHADQLARHQETQAPKNIEDYSLPELLNLHASPQFQAAQSEKRQVAANPLYGPEINDQALAAALAKAQPLAAGLTIAHGITNAFNRRLGPRYAMPESDNTSQIQQLAYAPVQAIMARRQAAQETLKADELKRQADVSKAMADPDSAESKQSQNFAAAAFPQLAGQLKGMSAAQIDRALPMLKLKDSFDAKALDRSVRAQAERTKENREAERERHEREQEGQRAGTEAEKLRQGREALGLKREELRQVKEAKAGAKDDKQAEAERAKFVKDTEGSEDVISKLRGLRSRFDDKKGLAGFGPGKGNIPDFAISAGQSMAPELAEGIMGGKADDINANRAEMGQLRFNVEKMIGLGARGMASPYIQGTMRRNLQLMETGSPQQQKQAFDQIERIVQNHLKEVKTAYPKGAAAISEDDPNAYGGYLKSGKLNTSKSTSAVGNKIRRTDPATGETRVWDGSKWVTE